MESNPLDFKLLRDFMRGLVAADLKRREPGDHPHPREEPEFKVQPGEKLTVKRLFQRLDAFLSDDTIVIVDAVRGAAGGSLMKPSSRLRQTLASLLLTGAVGCGTTRPLGRGWAATPRVHGRTSRNVARARALLDPLARHLEDACLGQVSELLEGEPPFAAAGAPAQDPRTGFRTCHCE